MSKPQGTVAAKFAAALKRHGVTVMFSQSLPSALILAAEDVGIRQIVYRTENAGGAMADGYARVTGRVGVVTAQNGPAATLLVPPLSEALKASVPLLALVQDVNRSQADRNAFQEFDHFKLFDGCAKWVRRLTDPARVDDYVDMALVAATSGRPGPAVLLLPADVLIENVLHSTHPRRASMGCWPLDRGVPAPALIDAAADLLSSANNPIVIAGGGVHGAQACAALASLQDNFHVPVAYTMMGKGSVADCHPLTVGLVGNVMGKRSLGRHMKSLLDNADCILLVGTRTNQNGTDSWSLIPKNAQIIQIDIDSQEVGRTYEPDVRLVGDAKLTLEALVERLGSKSLTKRRQTRTSIESKIAQSRQHWKVETEAVRRSSATPIRPERIMDDLRACLSPDTVVVADASYSSVWINVYLDALACGQRFLAPRGLAGLGWGYPMALGAQAGRAGAPIVCVAGDGGFGHCWAELETAARMKLPTTLIVLNNSVLGFQKDAEKVKFGRYTGACHFQPVDHAAIARACGVEAHRIEDPKDIAPVLQRAMGRNQPVLLDVITDPYAFPPLTMFDQLEGT